MAASGGSSRDTNYWAKAPTRLIELARDRLWLFLEPDRPRIIRQSESDGALDRLAPSSQVPDNQTFRSDVAARQAWSPTLARRLLSHLLVRTAGAINLTAQRDRRLREKLSRELGPEILAALADSSVIEIVLNADGELWCERLGKPLTPMGVRMSRVQAETLLGTVAALVDREINDERPILVVLLGHCDALLQ